MRLFESKRPFKAFDLEFEKGLMESLAGLLFGTIALRPYVFIFLLVYLIGCSLHLGLKRAVSFCVAGYFVTWLSEYSSIHNGFPYGYYIYAGTTMGRELWILGVPFMDSLSYVFLAYASFSLALLAVSPVRLEKKVIYILETKGLRYSLKTTVLGALFMTCLDVIIDPVALRGERWFLGKIHEYPAGGVYFGVPISNFAGWFLVGFILIMTLQRIDKYLGEAGDITGYRFSWRYLIGPALYYSVLLFNLCITFFIGEYAMAGTGFFIVVCLTTLLLYSKVRLSSGGEAEAALSAHLNDFPMAETVK